MVRAEKLYHRIRAARIWKQLLLLSCLGASFMMMAVYGGKPAATVFISLVLLYLYLQAGRWSGIARVSAVRHAMGDGEKPVFAAGMDVLIRVQLQIPGYWPIPYVVVSDELLRSGGEALRYDITVIPDARRQAEAAYRIPSIRRGHYSFNRTQFATSDILGLFQYRSKLDLPYSFAVLPRMTTISEWNIASASAGPIRSAAASARSPRYGIESPQTSGIREYQPGDRLSRIHWSASARTGSLKSKEFERETQSPLLVLLDRHRGSYETDDLFELAVSIAASILRYGAGSSLSMGLLSFGATGFQKTNAQDWKQQIRHLTAVAPDAAAPLPQVIREQRHMLPSGHCLLLISPSCSEELLQSICQLSGSRVSVQHLLPAAGKDRHLIQKWKEKLRASGSMVYPVEKLEELAAVLRGGIHESKKS